MAAASATGQAKGAAAVYRHLLSFYFALPFLGCFLCENTNLILAQLTEKAVPREYQLKNKRALADASCAPLSALVSLLKARAPVKGGSWYSVCLRSVQPHSLWFNHQEL